MSTARTLWIIFCCSWAGVWLIVSFFTFFLALPLAPLSLAAILIPVGSEPRPPLPDYRPPRPPARPEPGSQGGRYAH